MNMTCQQCGETVSRCGFYGHCIHCGHDLSQPADKPCLLCIGIPIAIVTICFLWAFL